jgi:hypothetical protein
MVSMPAVLCCYCHSLNRDAEVACGSIHKLFYDSLVYWVGLRPITVKTAAAATIRALASTGQLRQWCFGVAALHGYSHQQQLESIVC